jgi:DNA-binding NtrC family response regulator
MLTVDHSRADSPDVHAQARVLIIEDEKPVAAVLQKLMELAGYSA